MVIAEDSQMIVDQYEYSAASPFQHHWDLYPRIYVAPKGIPILDKLDGDLTKEPWNRIPWSEDFDDIRGPEDAPQNERPNPDCRTRFKAFWDETHLYIGGMIQSDMETQAHFTERNSPIYQKDSDFEVFVDPLGSCHFYKELEVNPLNTVWNLMLDKPYRDGGVEHSGRIARKGEEHYYEVYGQKTATKILKGRLNDPKDPATWSVEIALSYKDILANLTVSETNNIMLGAMWRVNFSRVEKNGKVNWTWQPQVSWDPTQRRRTGVVDMHLPESWGYFVFADDIPDGDDRFFPTRDGSWPARLAASNLYYAQRHYFEVHKQYAKSVQDLKHLVDPNLIDPFERIDIKVQEEKYLATIHGNPDGSVVSINEERLIQVTAPARQASPPLSEN